MKFNIKKKFRNLVSNLNVVDKILIWCGALHFMPNLLDPIVAIPLKLRSYGTLVNEFHSLDNGELAKGT